jgi:PAS domain S-box-containing protein
METGMAKPSYDQLSEKVGVLERELSSLRARAEQAPGTVAGAGGSDTADHEGLMREGLFSTAFHCSPLLMAISRIDDGRFIDVNKRFLDVIRCSREDVIGKTSRDLNLFVDPEQRDEAIREINATGHTANKQVRIRTSCGEIRIGLFNAEILSLGDGRYLFTMMNDITERKAADDRLRGHLALNMALAGLAGSIISRSFSLADIASIVLEYARVLTGSEHGFVTEIDPATGDNIILSTSNMPGVEVFGILHKIDAAPGDGAGRSYPGLRGHALNTRQPFFTNDPAHHPSWDCMKDGHNALNRFLSVPVIFGNEPVGEIAVADAPRDYTDENLLVVRRLAALYAMAINRIRGEEQLNNSLREKEMLIKELHHRVKNNLQVISSLLSLQSRKVEDERYRGLFQESQNRIHAMALVHEKLYHSEVMAKIDFGKYIHELTQHLFYSYNINRHLVRLDLEVREVFLGLDVAVPCAMIINELVSNALKHAFPGGRRGVVSVALSSGDGGKHLLAVTDDGIGMPAGFDAGASDSLGMQIVQSLTRQIRGAIAISGEAGTRVTIAF